MKLKTQIVLILVFIIALLALVLTLQQMRAIRIGIADEIETAGDIGSQVLSRVNEIYLTQGAHPMRRFLTRLGRLRAHDITLLDEYNDVIYRTPAMLHADTSKVPRWFDRAVSPDTTERIFNLSNATLIVHTDGSRAIVEGWEEFKFILASILGGVLALSLLAWWLIGRAMRPFDEITAAFKVVGHGDYSFRLPELRGAEANAVGTGFNSMIDSLEVNLAASEAEALAKAELQRNRDLTQAIRTRIEHEHRSLAQELHDELGQHVTAIKSMAVSILRRENFTDPVVVSTSRQIAKSADSIHATIRQILVSLRPASLDQFGLTDAIDDLVSDWRINHPGISFVLNGGDMPVDISPEISTATYRIVQEAITNAVRHSRASNIQINLTASPDKLEVVIEDNGDGLEHNAVQGFGLTGMKERAFALRGSLQIGSGDNGGCLIRLTIPLSYQYYKDNLIRAVR